MAKGALNTAVKLFAAASSTIKASELLPEFGVWFAEEGSKLARLAATAAEAAAASIDEENDEE